MRLPIMPPAGLVSDETNFAAPGLWADASNVRFRNGKPQVDGGYVKALNTAPTGTCRNVHIWADRSGVLSTAFGTHSHLFVAKGGDLQDVTPVGLPEGAISGTASPGYGSGPYGEDAYGESIAVEYFARTWSFATSGDFLYANPKNFGICVYENDLTAATELSNAPEQVYSILITPERQLLAFGCNEETSGDFNGMCIRGSGIDADYNNWDTTDSVTRPFEYILEGGSQIVKAGLVSSYVMVWTDTHLHQGQYVGTLDQAYRFDPVASNCGLIGPNALTIVNQTAYWITPDLRFMVWVPGSEPQAIPCPIWKDFRDNLVRSQAEKIVAVSVAQYGEIRFFYPDKREGNENSRYVRFSVTDGKWSRGILARSAAVDAGPTKNPLYVAPASYAYWHEVGETADGGPIDWFIQTSDLYIDEAERRGLIRGIWPDFEDQRGPVNLTIYCRDRPQSPTIYTKGPYPLATGQAKKDFMIDTRIASFKFHGNSAPAYMRMGKPSIDVQATGRE